MACTGHNVTMGTEAWRHDEKDDGCDNQLACALRRKKCEFGSARESEPAEKYDDEVHEFKHTTINLLNYKTKGDGPRLKLEGPTGWGTIAGVLGKV